MEYTHFVNICLISTIRAGIFCGIFFTQAHATAIVNKVERDQPCADAGETIDEPTTVIRESLIDTTILDLINSNASNSYDFFDLTRLKIEAGTYLVICDNSTTGANCNLEVDTGTGWLQKVADLHDDTTTMNSDGLMFGLMANVVIDSNLLTHADSITYAGTDGIFSPSVPDQRASSRDTNDRISFRLHSNLLCWLGIRKCNHDGL